MALAAGDDGLDLVETILREAPAHLSEQGMLFVEVGNSQVHMVNRFPGLEVEWLTFAQGGQGIFAVSKETLQRYWQDKE